VRVQEEIKFCQSASERRRENA
jgi:hypothetical protein